MAVYLVQKFHSEPVTPFMDAVVNYMALGNGVYQGILDGMAVSVSNGQITIKTGFCSVLGYQIYNNSVTTISAPSGSVYTVGVSLTVVDEQSVGKSYSDAMDAYEREAADAKSSSDLANALSKYNSTVSGLSNDDAVFATRTGSSTEPETSILTEGKGTNYVPLWLVSGGTVSTISPLTPGVPDYAKNLLMDGYFGTRKTSEIFNDFEGNDRPGTRYADRAKACDLADCIGSTGNTLDSNLKVEDGGYLTMTVCLFRSKGITLSDKATTSVSCASTGSKMKGRLLRFYGKDGSLICQTGVNEGITYFSLDADEHIAVAYNQSGNLMKFTVNLGQYTDGTDVTLSDEFSVVSCYAEGAIVEL